MCTDSPNLQIDLSKYTYKFEQMQKNGSVTFIGPKVIGKPKRNDSHNTIKSIQMTTSFFLMNIVVIGWSDQRKSHNKTTSTTTPKRLHTLTVVLLSYLKDFVCPFSRNTLRTFGMKGT